MGIGKEDLFWEGNWVGSGALKTVFPESVKSFCGGSIRGMEQRNVGLEFCREKEIKGLLSQKVQGVSFNLDKEDRWVWKEGEEFRYTVKSAYLRLRGN